ncbi:hypothetical protein ElyMa_005412900, partial [Elysia marginata]
STARNVIEEISFKLRGVSNVSEEISLKDRGVSNVINSEVISETALWTIDSVLPHCDVRSACVHHTLSHYSDIGPTRLNTKSTMPDTRRISC